MENQFQHNYKVALNPGKVEAKSPSNIALIKYWGKEKNQIPANSSISFTLTKSFTATELHFKPKSTKGFEISVILDQENKPSFLPKIEKFFEAITAYIPFLEDFTFEVHTSNSFPHSSGIASSASGMSALAICLVKMEQEFGANLSEEDFLKKASFLSRLGSGSACRSVYKGLVEWGKNVFITGSSDLYAIPYPYEIHPNFVNFQDTILLVHEGQKDVSSTAGHNLMNNHPYASRRFEAANENLEKMKAILANGDLTAFGELVEHEALSLHAVMMTSKPAYILMQPNTVAIIQKVWAYRKSSQNPLYFTLDAGANVHLLYPKNNCETIQQFIQTDLLPLCENGKAIWDQADF